MPDRYFQINDDVGLDPEGNQEPLCEIGVNVLTHTMADGEVIDITTRVALQPLEGTRIVKTDDPRVAEQLLGSGLVEEIDPPTKADLRKQQSQTREAVEKAGTHVSPEEAAAAETPQED